MDDNGKTYDLWLARLEGFEPPAYGLEVRCSIQLSYRRTGRYLSHSHNAVQYLLATPGFLSS